MSHDVIATCPVCSNELTVTRLACRQCGTTLEGDFAVGRFGRLNREQMAMLESFLRSRGNLREMERELGISYPTVRSRVDALVRALGFADGAGPAEDDVAEPEAGAGPGPADGSPAAPPMTPDELAAARREILERVGRHELSAQDAAAEIRALTQGGAS
jgi:hypothetical protein